MQRYELRFNDGIINTHPEVVKQVILLQSNLRKAHCFNDLKIDGLYGRETLKGMMLMKRRINLEINDRANAQLWNYLLDSFIEIVPKPIKGLELPSDTFNYVPIEENRLYFYLARLVAIPIIDKLNHSQIIALIMLAYYYDFDYGLPTFTALNKSLELGAITNIPKVVRLYQSDNKRITDTICKLWNS